MMKNKQTKYKIIAKNSTQGHKMDSSGKKDFARKIGKPLVMKSSQADGVKFGLRDFRLKK